jgi:hypothetical protein
MAKRIGNRGKKSDAQKAKSIAKNDVKRAEKRGRDKEEEEVVAGPVPSSPEPRAKRPKLVHSEEADDVVGMGSAPGDIAPVPSSPGFVLGPVSPSGPPGLEAYFEAFAEEQTAVLRGASSPAFVPASPVLRASSPAVEPTLERTRSISPAASRRDQDAANILATSLGVPRLTCGRRRWPYRLGIQRQLGAQT